jgi:hypothetical protein
MLEPIAGVTARERMERWFADRARPAGGRGSREEPPERPRPSTRARAAAALRRAADRLEPGSEPRPAGAR